MKNGGGYFSFVFLDLPKLAGSFKLTAKGSKAHSKSMGCQIPDSEQEAVTWLTFSAPERNTFIFQKNLPFDIKHTVCSTHFDLKAFGDLNDMNKQLGSSKQSMCRSSSGSGHS